MNDLIISKLKLVSNENNDINDNKQSNSNSNLSKFNSDTNSVKTFNTSEFIKVFPERKFFKLSTLVSSNFALTNLNANNISALRKDQFHNEIKKGGKEHKITFKENFAEIIFIESYKEYNIKSNEIKKQNNECISCLIV